MPLRRPPKLPRPRTLPTSPSRKVHRKSGAPLSDPQTTPAPSHIAAHEYRPETEQLIVTFRSGPRYAYAGVPAALYEEMQGAVSLNRFLQARVIGKFDVERLED